MVIKNCRSEELKKYNLNDLYILTDFDGTLTLDSSDSSWSSIFKNPIVSKEFIKECTNVFNYYHKIEIDDTLDNNTKYRYMNDWYKENIQILKKFNITKDTIDYVANNVSIIHFRQDAKEFLKIMYENNVPVIIISAGVGNIIEQFLIRNNCNYPNIHICSNFLEYKNGVVENIKDGNLIHPLNKNEVSLPLEVKNILENKSVEVILGNNIEDLKMCTGNKNLYSIGFIDDNIKDKINEFKEYYDIVCTDNESYKKIIELFNILYK